MGNFRIIRISMLCANIEEGEKNRIVYVMYGFSNEIAIIWVDLVQDEWIHAISRYYLEEILRLFLIQ